MVAVPLGPGDFDRYVANHLVAVLCTMYGVDKAIQAHLNRLAEHPSVKLAIFCFHPSPKSQKFRFCSSSAYADSWEMLESLVQQFRSDGHSERIDNIVRVNELNHHLIATTNGSPDQGSFIVALVFGSPAQALSATNILADIASTCTGESYSIKWK